MTARYAALICDDLATRSRVINGITRSCDLIEVHKSSRVAVLANRSAVFARLGTDHGIVLGPLFKRQASERVSAVNLKAGTDPVGVAPELIRDYWGGYVAVIEGASDQRAAVIRDPSGAMPCFYHAASGILLVASDVEILLASGLVRPSIDWAYLRGHLGAYDLRTERTALTEVAELRPGYQCSLDDGTVKMTPVWSPWDFTERGNASNDEEVAIHLRNTVSTCVAGWASRFGKILLGMSGGLDSSLLASCLSQQKTPWAAFTMITDDKTGDERRYADVMANHVNVDLKVGRSDLADVQLDTSRSAHLPRPTGFGFGQSQDRARETFAVDEAADAHFTGIGGDNVFCLMTSATPIIDRVLSGSGPSEILATTLDVCRLTGCSVGEALLSAGQRFFSPKPAFGRRPHLRFLNKRNWSNEVEPSSHPWLDCPRRYLPGKAVHIAMLARIHGTMDGYPRTAKTPLVMPLLSQPILEACLAIPTWKWCAGGINRSVVRRGFADRLPRAILYRTSKGGPEGFCAQVLEHQKAELRAFLLDGELATHDILDLDELRAVLNPEIPLGETDLPIIAKLVEAEAWSRHWSRRTSALSPKPGQ